ncbi:hypothetical protein EFBL_1613 [Effusibacillus lacus]|uniref:Uncharacterized protein n=1 Tax=Effusibacillus lacus TaxID=1348429 RepID=A0A292YH06_9BACL|nr:hypothetical protein EFBL_1613 [Effusibacillus lacus]
MEETIPALPGNDGLVRERGKYGWVVDEWGSTSRSWSDGTSGSNESDPIKPEVDADYVKYWRITITPLEGQAVPPINVRSNGASLRASVVFTAPGKYHGVAKAVSKKGRIVETVEFSVYVPSKYVGKPLQVPPAAVIKRAEHFISGGGRIEPGKKERSQPLRTFFIERRIEIDLR